MGRRRKLDAEALGVIAVRLAGVKCMIDESAEALPRAARDLRRNAVETIEDIIVELKRV